METNQPIRIVLADDQAIIRQGLCFILNAQPDLEVVAEAADGDEAVEAVLRHQPDIALLDIRMPKRTGIEATRAILEAHPDQKVILLTTFDVQEYVFDGIRAGAVGYLLKDAGTKELVEHIRSACQGAALYMSTTAGKALSQAFRAGQEPELLIGSPPELQEPLTDKELEVLQHMAYGRRNAEIAHLLCVTEGTIKTHINRIFRKLGVEDRTQAVVLAMRQHIVK